MGELQVHVLRFRAEVTAPLRLPAAAGAALRGALFEALRAQFCVAGGGPTCGTAPAVAGCPVCFLLAPVDEGAARGRDVPRPYALSAPAGPAAYAPGATLEFGLATFGHALGHFPYALLGVEEMGRNGLGSNRRGAFRLDEVWAEHPLLGRQEAVYRRARGDGQVRTPALPVVAGDVADEAARLADAGGDQRLRLVFATPTRLVEGGTLVKAGGFAARPLVARLLERLTALHQRYGDGPPPFDAPALLAAAGEVRVVERTLAWRELFRASGRHRRMVPMGGLVGEVVVAGDLGPFLPWLVWGTLTHVGKDAAMGNGQLRLEPLS